MKLKITHRTQYDYSAPVSYTLTRVRLCPPTCSGQAVKSWALRIEGAREELRFLDHYTNDTRLLSISGTPELLAIEASGEIETTDKSGVFGQHTGPAPLWLFQGETKLTAAAEGVASIVGAVPEGGDIGRLHDLMAVIADRVEYREGSTSTATTAEEAISSKAGVCQDHTHVFISAARSLGFPARYVSGYLMMEGETDQAAMHAWAEAHVKSLGWVGFDVANGMSPDDRYVRIACGRDYAEAAPISGFRLGQADERLEVTITVEQ
jgi:transglutaminase-like putative cysteine protease